MQTENSQKVIARFFRALDILKGSKIIRGKNTFARRYNIDGRNFYKIEKDHSRDIFQVEWLSALVADYKINPLWLLCGQEPFFQPPYNYNIVRNLQNTCKTENSVKQITDNK